MPASAKAPSPPVRLLVEKLTQDAFAPFGTVIENPLRTPGYSPGHLYTGAPGSAKEGPSRTRPVSANRGTALRFNDVSPVDSLYRLAPSRKRARVTTTMFVCTPRDLSAVADSSDASKSFSIEILERHPFTTQTFIPIGLATVDRESSYLVIVAPTLPTSKPKGARPPPFPTPEPRRRRSLKEVLSGARPPPFPERPLDSKPSENTRKALPGPGLPDLLNCKAFIANGSQAVTYAAGTWHAPMAVLGAKPLEFVVVQYANGVAEEDCQEVELAADGSEQGLFAHISAATPGWGGLKLPSAKL
ncbi:MAG: Ureidoglycolate lyase [Piccolia ochrophora]|nr:MAG: Ureidoglycolate lyase [Piccolia ochrophora]